MYQELATGNIDDLKEAVTASPSRGVMGGIGGGSTDYGTLTLVAGGALVGTGIAATAWYLRRRSTPRHL